MTPEREITTTLIRIGSIWITLKNEDSRWIQISFAILTWECGDVFVLTSFFLYHVASDKLSCTISYFITLNEKIGRLCCLKNYLLIYVNLLEGRLKDVATIFHII